MPFVNRRSALEVTEDELRQLNIISLWTCKDSPQISWRYFNSTN